MMTEGLHSRRNSVKLNIQRIRKILALLECHWKIMHLLKIVRFTNNANLKNPNLFL